MINENDYHDSTPTTGVTISLADELKVHLQSFVGSDGEPFKEMIDAFRFAVSLGLSVNKDCPPDIESRPATTMYNMGTFDSDMIFKEAISIIAPDAIRATSLTRLIRAYGEWGIEAMNKEMLESGGELSIIDIIAKLIKENH